MGHSKGALIGTLLAFCVASPVLADPCTGSTSCSYGSGSCSTPCDGGVCMSSCICDLTAVGCYCHCLRPSLEPDFGTPGTPKPRNQPGTTMSFGGSYSLKGVAVLIHDFGWGVVLSGTTTVGTGTYSGNLDDVVDEIGDDNGFTASWNTSTGVVTLSATH